ncbi:MAG: BatD family protein [Ginsengibacter sp.]
MDTFLLKRLHKVVSENFVGDLSKGCRLENKPSQKISGRKYSSLLQTFCSFRIIVFFTLLFVSSISLAQVQFSVVCPNKKIGKNDLVDIQFKVENASHVGSIIPPSFKDFNVVSGPNQQSSMSSINGKVTQYVSIGFSLQPKSPGKYIIGPATAEADGTEYKSKPVTITVTTDPSLAHNNRSIAPSPSPFPNFNFDLPDNPVSHQFTDYILKPGEDAAEKIKKNLFIKLDVSKKDCFVGEPVVAAFKLYTRLHSETTITDAPSFNGFSVSDLEVNNNNNSKLEKYDGRLYNVYTLRKVELYPLQAGNITLDPVVADNKVTFIKSAYANSQDRSSFFNMLENFGDAGVPASGLVEQKITLKTTPTVINVKPLPSENKPNSFKGAVGKFNVVSSLGKDSISTDDAGVLKVTVSGQGNIQLVNAPTIVWPKGIDGYEAKVKDNVDKTTVPMQGNKVFSFPFTVSRQGNYTIDSILFSYFDPSSKEYKTILVPPLQVHVRKGNTIRHLFTDKRPTDSPPFISHVTEVLLGIALIAAIIFLIFFLVIRKKKNEGVLEKNVRLDDIKYERELAEKEFTIPESPLLDAHEKMTAGDSSGFLVSMDSSLKRYLSQKLKIPLSELSKKRLNEELDKCNVSLNTSLMLTSLLDEVEINLYAPPSNTTHLIRIYEKASEVISLLDKQVCD